MRKKILTGCIAAAALVLLSVKYISAETKMDKQEKNNSNEPIVLVFYPVK